MKTEILLEIIKKWNRDSEEPDTQDGSEQAKIPNAKAKGYREGKKKCAEDLLQIVTFFDE